MVLNLHLLDVELLHQSLSALVPGKDKVGRPMTLHVSSPTEEGGVSAANPVAVMKRKPSKKGIAPGHIIQSHQQHWRSTMQVEAGDRLPIYSLPDMGLEFENDVEVVTYPTLYLGQSQS